MAKDENSSVPRRQQQRRRRSDNPRRRNPERTRQAILDAANEEFGRYGFDGARVVRIAQTAGVNHQLITYHFGGKRGLFDAITDRWATKGEDIYSSAEPYAEIVRRYVRLATQDQEGPTVRLLARAELDENPPASPEWMARLHKWAADGKERQARGEIRADLDIAAVVLAFFGASVVPAVFPQLTAALTESDPGSPEFMEHYADQLARMMSALAEVPREAH